MISSLIYIIFMSLVARAEPLRLIETSENHQEWMNREQIEALSSQAHDEGHCGGFMDVTRFVDSRGKRKVSSGDGDAHTKFILAGRLPMFESSVEKVLKEVSPERYRKNIEKLSSFKNRYYDSEHGVQSMEWIASQFHRMRNFFYRDDVVVEFFDHADFKQPSVIATIPGEGALAKEIIVIGGHGDSINHREGGGSHADAPGADDNASGTSVVLETFRAILDSGFKPKRTLQFMVYAGEEEGLLGSQDIAEDYRKKKENVVAVLQLDMTLFPGSGMKIHFITDHTNSDLNKYMQMLSDKYVKIPWSTDRCNYACSDHASWNRYGYASAFPFESRMSDDNKKIHSKSDLIDKSSNFDFAMSFVHLAVAYMVELGSEKGSKYRYINR